MSAVASVICVSFGMWLLLAAVAMLLRRVKNPLLWATVSGFFGLMFGALCAPVDVFIGGMSYAVTKWISGIPFDISHCIGNFVMALILFAPLRKRMEKMYNK